MANQYVNKVIIGKEVKLDRRFSEPFFLKSRDGKFPLRFDCANCQMFVLNPDS